MCVIVGGRGCVGEGRLDGGKWRGLGLWDYTILYSRVRDKGG